MFTLLKKKRERERKKRKKKNEHGFNACGLELVSQEYKECTILPFVIFVPLLNHFKMGFILSLMLDHMILALVDPDTLVLNALCIHITINGGDKHNFCKTA